MVGACKRPIVVVLAALAVALGIAGTAGAAIAPPWCGTPIPDAAENLPDGTDPADPVGSFPHIPYYAIGCTLDQIAAQSNGRMTVQVAGVSALGNPLYSVVINAQDTVQQQRAYGHWRQWRATALEDPALAQDLLGVWGDEIKVPLFVQGGIHGNEYEGVDSNMRVIEELATTPYGTNPDVDAVLDHAVVIFNVIQNPDGRIAGARANGNGFDLNRDFLTQSQSETKASVTLMQEWLPVEVLDLHGYATPTLIEATTKPHNPSIEYDLWLKWNQARIDANEAALNAVGLEVQRPINDWCEDADLPPISGICPGGTPPGPAVAEGWDDWGPFYTPMYAQHVGLNGSTVEMCNSTGTGCGVPGSTTHALGRLGALQAQHVTTWSTLVFDVANRSEMLYDEAERYRRGVEDQPRPACCPSPFDVANNWMVEFPDAYVVPVGAGQRSDAEAARLVDWLIFNGIKVDELKDETSFGGQTFQRGSYVVWMNQAHRGLADTALSVGLDISSSISVLYAPPGAWSHGYLWGADVVTIPQSSGFVASTRPINKPNRPSGGLENGRANVYALELDSATAVRAVNALVGGGVSANLALEAFPARTGESLPAGTVLFPADPATKAVLGDLGRTRGLLFRSIFGSSVPDLIEPVDGVPAIAVLTGAVNQDVWVLRNLGFTADPVSTALINAAPVDPLLAYDVVWNTGGWPSAALPTARARLTAFFGAGGGYLGTGTNGASFLTASLQVAGLTAANRGGSGRSGIVLWNNEGGAISPIVGAYPGQDTAIMDPPTWYTAVPASLSVDARLPLTGFFLAGMWLLDAQSATAPGSPLVVHGLNTAGTARIAAFAFNPLYRADPEREWPMAASAAYWADQ